MSKPIKIASRKSPLALWQANTVGEMLKCEYEIVEVSTTGDIKRDVSIAELGGVGAFAKEIQLAVLNGDADIALHSAKDLPSITPDGLDLVSVPLRGDVRDALVGSTLQDLPYGAVVGTGAQRRRAQLAALRPDLQFEDLRGNINSRLEKAVNFDAIVVANVALERLGKTDRVTQILTINEMLPQVSQGALAIEVRSDDQESREIALAINDKDAYACVSAERAFLETLGGGCSVPCAAFATMVDSNTIWLRALLAEPRGRKVAKAQAKGIDPKELGVAVAQSLLVEHGGEEIMELVI